MRDRSSSTTQRSDEPPLGRCPRRRPWTRVGRCEIRRGAPPAATLNARRMARGRPDAAHLEGVGEEDRARDGHGDRDDVLADPAHLRRGARRGAASGPLRSGLSAPPAASSQRSTCPAPHPPASFAAGGTTPHDRVVVSRAASPPPVGPHARPRPPVRPRVAALSPPSPCLTTTNAREREPRASQRHRPRQNHIIVVHRTTTETHQPARPHRRTFHSIP